jgi:5-methyltetrahydropteroyltriglutamate--homocysteine methyltransferase
MSEVLLTQEVGSLAKPDWRVQPFKNAEISCKHLAEAERWAGRLNIDASEPLQILTDAQALLQEYGELSPTSETAIKLLAARFAVRLQEKAGLDILYDGEQDRAEMYQAAVEGTEGFEPRGRVRAFDNKSYLKSALVEPPQLAGPWHDDEFTRLQEITGRSIKIPITGAYTIGAWTFDEYYARKLPPKQAREQFVLGLARDVIRPNIASLLEAGAEWIQIDEPAATTVPDEVELFVKSFNESVRGLEGRFSVHICFSDYSLLFPAVEALENCSQFSLEFANKDSDELGTDKANRPAYEILRAFRKHTPETGIGLGVSDVHEDKIESSRLIRDRVLRAVDIIGDPALIYPSPDCGLRTRSWDVAYEKLQRVVEGADLARDQL